MDDFLWIIIAVIGLVFSVANKAMKRQQEQAGRSQEAPKWPGPVAGPRPGQGPTWAPPPSPQPSAKPTTSWAPQPRVSEVPRGPKAESGRQAQKTLVSGDVFTRPLDAEGYGTEGVGSEGQGFEGPGPGEGVEEELTRFSRETEQMEHRQLAELSENLGRSQKGAVVTADEGGPVELQEALADRASLTRAVVLSEVLGKPKALRGRGVRR